MRASPRRGTSALQDDVRHVPFAHRGEEHARRHPRLKNCLAHVHISENDRSTPGPGNVRWAENFDTLHEIGYDDLMVIEAFGLALDKIVAATKIWRRMYQSERQLATDGLRFMKQEVAKRWK